jgi:hypothetical protein
MARMLVRHNTVNRITVCLKGEWVVNRCLNKLSIESQLILHFIHEQHECTNKT